MPRSQLIKFRLSNHAKERISRHAERSQKSVAALMRDLTAEAIVGRSMNDRVRSDMVAMRQWGNALLTHAQALGTDHPLGTALQEIGTRIRETASRHLSSPS